MTTAVRRGTARERLLEAADELFYEEGIHSVGIDRIIERADVAKASLYSTFGSKDALVRAYLEGKDAERRERLTAAMAEHRTPRAKILAVFDSQAASAARPTYRGCAFVNAMAESDTAKIAGPASDTYRGWFRGVMRDLAAEAGARDSEELARRLVMVYDAAATAYKQDHDDDSAAVARSLAELVLDDALPRRRRR